ncbi:amidohydrolase [Macrococcus brunensis]|uniref:amidohydrolase n=1 Tax=Macrococcus brunensis TaxID=198483 RepID=UPI001EF054DF|nr:amidohydrolase [Macrococcus brunensis]ULG72356.1 amidohydrolase [Macrococcus brunensis]
MKLFYGGTIYTMQQEDHKVKAVLVEGNRIKALYDEVPEIEAEYFDLQGAVMFPGFVDTHIHLVGTGMALGSVNFKDDTSIEEVKEQLRNAARQLPSESWLVCEGYNDNQLNYRLTRNEIDELADCRVIIKRVCRHAAIVNSAALKAMNIQDDVEDMDAGHFEKIEGRLNGWVHDHAMDLFVNASLNETVDSLKRHMERAAYEMHAVGLTGIHTEDLGYYNSPDNVFTAYTQVFGKNKIQLRLNLLRHYSVFEDLADYPFTDWLKKDAMKFYADGALGGRTALFREPYSDQSDTNGLAIFSQEELEEQVQRARRHNATVAVHIIGDRACEMVLDAIEKYPPISGHDRLIHVSFLSPDLIGRMKNMPVTCDVQPLFATSDFPWAIDRVGEKRSRYAYAWKSLVEAGIMIGGGSDSPIESFNPLKSIDAAVNRRPFGSQTQYFTEECLSVYEALKLFTVNAAVVGHRPDNGMIKAGYLADFTVLERDLLTTGNIADIRNKMTIVDGDIVYRQ